MGNVVNVGGARGLLNPALRKLVATVQSIALTEHEHLSCIFDTPEGRLRAVSDALAIHMPELAVGRRVKIALLRRRTGSAHWSSDWQLVACHGMPESTATAQPCARRQGRQ